MHARIPSCVVEKAPTAPLLRRSADCPLQTERPLFAAAMSCPILDMIYGELRLQAAASKEQWRVESKARCFRATSQGSQAGGGATGGSLPPGFRANLPGSCHAPPNCPSRHDPLRQGEGGVC
jgi:hypothetical protein